MDQTTTIDLSLSVDVTCCRNAKKCCKNTEVLLQKYLNSVVQQICFSSRLVFHGSRWVFMVFQGSRSVFMIFYSSRSAFMLFQGSRLVFHGSRWVLWLFKVPGRSSWFFMILGRFLWFQVSLHPSWALQARSETLRTPKMFSLYLYLGPMIPLGLAGRRPALA